MSPLIIGAGAALVLFCLLVLFGLAFVIYVAWILAAGSPWEGE